MGYIDINTKEFISGLQQGIVEVVFDKLDGQTRVMRCTLQKSRLPQNRDPQKVEEFHRSNHEYLNIGEQIPKETVTVWDIDQNAWRSFRTDRVVSAMQLNVG